jgi:hypothetical protein
MDGGPMATTVAKMALEIRLTASMLHACNMIFSITAIN